jgi:ATP-dependent RNA helicase DDX3X
MLFSATFPKEARKLAAHYLDGDHIRLTMGRAGSTLDHITQFVRFSIPRDGMKLNLHKVVAATEPTKEQMLYQLLMDHAPARTIIFVNNKRSADQLDDFLYNQGFPSTSLHSDRTQREREDAL